MSAALATLLLLLTAQQRGELTSDEQTYEPMRDTYRASGHVTLTTPELRLLCEEVTYNRREGRASARGRIRLVTDDLLVATADTLELDVTNQRLVFGNARLWQKKNVTYAQLLAAKTPEAWAALGEDEMSATAAEAVRLSPSLYQLRRLTLELCACDPEAPSLRVSATRAKIRPGDSAALFWPVVRLGAVPIFAFPWLDIPLTKRRTGLLVPKPSFSAANGFSLEQPVFITLGPSYDVTLTPGYFFGAGDPSKNYGIRGPRLLTELNYAPQVGMNGRAMLGLLYDFKAPRHVVTDQRLPGPARSGLRGEATLLHTHVLGDGFENRVSAYFYSDGYLVRDLVADTVLRPPTYSRSTAVLLRRTPNTFTSLDVGLTQDLQWGYPLFGLAPGTTQRGPNPLHRLPAFTFALPPLHVTGPLHAGMQLELVRMAPTQGASGDEGTDGVHSPRTPDGDGSQGNRRFEVGEREARDRLSLRPKLAASLGVGRVLQLQPSLTYWQDVWRGEVTGRVQQRGFPLLGLNAHTALFALFPKGEEVWRHDVRPAIDLRFAPSPWGTALTPRDADLRPLVSLQEDLRSARRSGEPRAAALDFELQSRLTALRRPLYEEADFALRPQGLRQAIVSIAQRLHVKRDGRVQEVLRLDLGQSFDFFRQRPVADAFGRLGTRVGPVEVSGTGRYDLGHRHPSALTADASVTDARGDRFFVAYQDLMDLSDVDQLRRANAGFVAPEPVSSIDRARQLVVGTTVMAIPQLSLRYQLTTEWQTVRPNPALTVTKVVPKPVFHSLGLGYGPRCQCWRLEGQVYYQPRSAIVIEPRLGAGLTFTVAGFGSFGGGG
jgi:LPS-assembly protein